MFLDAYSAQKMRTDVRGHVLSCRRLPPGDDMSRHSPGETYTMIRKSAPASPLVVFLLAVNVDPFRSNAVYDISEHYVLDANDRFILDRAEVKLGDEEVLPSLPGYVRARIAIITIVGMDIVCVCSYS